MRAPYCSTPTAAHHGRPAPAGRPRAARHRRPRDRGHDAPRRIRPRLAGRDRHRPDVARHVPDRLRLLRPIGVDLCPSRSRSRRPNISCAVAFAPTAAAPPTSQACTPLARSPRPVSMGRTGSPRTVFSRVWSSDAASPALTLDLPAANHGRSHESCWARSRTGAGPRDPEQVRRHPSRRRRVERCRGRARPRRRRTARNGGAARHRGSDRPPGQPRLPLASDYPQSDPRWDDHIAVRLDEAGWPATRTLQRSKV